MAKTTSVRKSRAKRGAKRSVRPAAKSRPKRRPTTASKANSRPAAAASMSKRGASTVDEYLAQLPTDRRPTVAAVRDVVLRNLPPGYEEAVKWGMICYQIPLASYANTYNDQPLCYAALAAQKNHYSLYLMGSYGPGRDETLKSEFEKAGKKLNMGKSCVRFRRLDDLPLDVIGDFVASIPPEKYIEHYEASRRK